MTSYVHVIPYKVQQERLPGTLRGGEGPVNGSQQLSEFWAGGGGGTAGAAGAAARVGAVPARVRARPPPAGRSERLPRHRLHRSISYNISRDG